MFGLTGVIVGGASVVALGGLLATGYVKAPTDTQPVGALFYLTSS